MSSATVPVTAPIGSTSPQLSEPWQAIEEPLYEIVNGQRVELPSMSAYATWVSSRLFGRLYPFTESNQLGTTVAEMLFILDEQLNLRRRPNVGFVASERWPADKELPETGDWAVVPDLAIEVVSPNDSYYQVMAKLQEYFQYKVRQVWIVSPQDRHIIVYSSPTSVRFWSAGEELDGGPLLPGFRLRVADIFRSEAQVGPKQG